MDKSTLIFIACLQEHIPLESTLDSEGCRFAVGEEAVVEGSGEEVVDSEAVVAEEVRKYCTIRPFIFDGLRYPSI